MKPADKDIAFSMEIEGWMFEMEVFCGYPHPLEKSSFYKGLW